MFEVITSVDRIKKIAFLFYITYIYCNNITQWGDVTKER